MTWSLGIAYRKRMELHVRFMISTGFAIGTAIVFRIFAHWVPGVDTENDWVLANGATLTLLLLVLIGIDGRRGLRRSPYWVVTILIGLMHAGYWSFARTDGWLAFCEWFAGLPW